MRAERDALLSVQRFFARVFPDDPWEIVLVVDGGTPPERPYVYIEQVDEAATTGAPAAQEIAIPITANVFLEAAATRKDADEAALLAREEVWKAVKWGFPPYRPITTDRIPLYDYDGRNEVQRVKITADAGTFTLALGPDVSGPIPSDPDAPTIAAALEVLAGIGADNVAVIRRGDGLFDVEFVGDLATTPVATLVADGGGLLGTGAAVAVTTMLEGAPAPVRAHCDYMRVASFGQRTLRDDDDPRMVMVAVDLRLTFARGAPVPLGQTVLQRVSVTDPIP